MYPPRPVPVVATDSNLTGMPMGPVGPMMPPPYAGPMINSPQNFVYIQDPFTEISQCTSAIIRQQPDLIEAVTGCATQNRYHIFLESPYGVKYAFKCNEYSDGCARCCLSGSARPLQIVMRHIISVDQLNADFGKIFINIDKPCQCGCLCFCRPYMDVKLADNGQRLGSIREPCTCCDIETDVYDANGSFRYQIYGDCCQLGLCCGSSAIQKLSRIYFQIRQNGVVVGSIRKLSSNIGEFFTKADSYQVVFPSAATPSDKLLLIITALMLDYQNFEKSDRDAYSDYY